jgi:hypothetical protein
VFRALKRLLQRGLVDPAQLALPLPERAVPPAMPTPVVVRPLPATNGTRPPAPPGGTPRRRKTAEEQDVAAAARLTARHAELNAERFGGVLRPIPIEVSRRLRSRLGYYRIATPRYPSLIVISRRHLRRHGWAEVFDTLLHEMVHQWQDESGLSVDHGAQFRAKARAVGALPRARRPVGTVEHEGKP